MSDRLLRCYAGRRVLITGHTGFKGAWLAAWLRELGAEVFGYALPEEQGRPTVYATSCLGITERLADVRDRETLVQCLREWRPTMLFHLAAQPLVRLSHADPLSTFAINLMGTVNVLDAARETGVLQAAVIVTTDKCYENREWCWPYRESDPLGGRDPYSASKACAEIAAAAYRRSFLQDVGCGVATARAGNVIGGGDWSRDRLVPDLARSLLAGAPARLRNPHAVRPFQHVLEALGGYLVLGERLLQSPLAADAWNFGPLPGTELSVGQLAESFVQAWGHGSLLREPELGSPPEAGMLRLDSSRAEHFLGWRPVLTNEEMVGATSRWYQASSGPPAGLAELTKAQLADYRDRLETSQP